MNRINRALLALTFVAAPVAAQPEGQIVASHDQALSFQAREAEARSRILEGSSSADEATWRDYLAIKLDPVAAAIDAAGRGDFRLIRFELRSFGRSSYESSFAGVDCSVVWSTGMARAVWINSFSDVVDVRDSKPGMPAFKESVAREYNLALLRHPAFPYADLCIESDSPGGKAIAERGRAIANDLRSRPQTQAFRIVPQRWWLRWSDRRVPASAIGSALTRAIRNGELLPSFDPAEVDATDEFGMTALGWAAARSSAKTVAQLLSQRADPWFGDQCSRRTRSSETYGLWGEDVMATPLVIAIVHGRQDIAMQMLRASPRKECANAPDNLPPLTGRQLAIRMVGAYATAFGATEVNRFMISDFLDQAAALDTSERVTAYNGMVEYAWDEGHGELLRSRPSAELRGARSFVRKMAAYTTRDELLYWIGRLDLRQPKAVEEMIGSVRFNRWSGSAMEDFEGKFETLASMGAGFAPSDKQAIVKRVFEGNALATDSGEAKHAAIGILDRHGYALGNAIFLDERGGQGACTPLMVALAYSYADECRHNKTDPTLAMALLDIGVDPNVGRTSSGLSALDIVERRTANGPWPDAFAKVRAKMIDLGAAAGSEAPEPGRR